MDRYLIAPKPKSPFVRVWPYPYRGGLSISNDAEYMSFPFFKDLMDFLNSSTDTKMGKGLNIPVTSSMFFYSAHPYNFSVFNGHVVDSKESRDAQEILDYVSRGVIDTIHAYGDFDGVGGFCRGHAQRCFDILQKNNLSLPIFTNHGGVENVQNIGADADYHQGDKVGSDAYHVDIMGACGVRYVWTDSMVLQKNISVEGGYYQRARNLAKTIIKSCGNENKRKKIVHSVRLNDGSELKGFYRFRSTGQNAPNLSSLGYQIHQINWDQFYAEGAALVLYQHLGVLHRVNGKCVPVTIEDALCRKSILLSPFYFLADEHHSGRLWMARLIEFLDYITLIESVDVQENVAGELILSCGDAGLPPSAFQNITIYIDTLKPVTICYGDRVLPYFVNGPDETGRYSVTIKKQE